MIRPVNSLSDPAWTSLMDLFRATFPPSTREPDEELEAEILGLSRVPLRYWVVEQGGDVRGFIRWGILERTQAVFVIHIATAPTFRGQGVGSRLLAAVRSQRPDLPVICEVDTGPEMAWWTARGAKTVSSAYVQPALRPDTESVPFHLMAIGSVTKPDRLIESFYQEVWEVPADHPWVRQTVEAIR